MAGRNSDIKVTVKGDADFGAARREAKDALGDIERKAKDVKLSPELDTAEIRKAIALAEQLDGMVATLDIDADPADIVQAEKLARSLRGFQARVDLSVEGKAELTEALGLADKMEGLRKVRVEVQGRQDLERAAQIADDLERRRTVPIDAQASDLVRLDSDVGDALSRGGEAGADGIAGALGDIDFEDIGATGLDKLTGALAAAGPWAALGGTVGAIFGDEFLDGFNNGLPSARADTIRALRTNLSGAELEQVGQAAGDAWADGFGESLPGLKDDAATLQAAFGAIDDDFDLSTVLRQAESVRDVFGLEIADQVRLVQQLVKNGLVPDTVSGFNLIAREAQTLGGATEDAFDIITEFSPVFKKLGIDGARAADIIATEFGEGLVTQIDRAGEQFEEFNIAMTDGSARDAVVALGLDFDKLQDKIANGKGQEALSEVAGALAAMPDKAQAATLGVDIFGASVESASDPQRVFELLATADAMGTVGTKGEDMAKALEDSATGLDRMKRIASDLGEELGGTVADGIDTLNSLAKMDFGDAATSAADFGDALAIKLLGPLGELSDRVGLDPLGPLKDGFDELFGSSEKLATTLPKSADGLADTGSEATFLGQALDDAAARADELESQLSGLFNFGADQMMRDIAEAGEDLAAALEDGAAKAVGLNGEIDITSKAGRDLQATMEGLNGILVDAAVAFTNGEISAEQYANIQGFVQEQLTASGLKADTTADKVQGLTNKYLDQEGIDSISTDLIANDLASSKISALQRALAALPTSKTITVTTINQSVGASASGTVRAKARGGWTEGLTLVGEEGPELIDVKGRAFVHTAAETRELLSNRGGALTGPAVPTTNYAGPRLNIERLVIDKGVDLWQGLLMAEKLAG